MFINRLKAKAVSGAHVVKNNIRRVVSRAPKMKFFYGSYYKKYDVIENRILFESFHGSTISDSPFYILKELLSRDDAKNYEIYYSTNPADYDTHKKFMEANNIPVKLVSITSYEYLKVLATAKYLVNNSSFPVYFIKKEEQVYLQTWHGTPLKTLGKQMRKGIESMYNVQHNFLQATYLMHPNEFTKDAIMRDYNLEKLYTGKVALSGYPRNSIFMDKDKAVEVRKSLGYEDKTLYAYMPTWRGTSNHSVNMNAYGKEVSEMMKYLDSQLKDNQILFVNFHPILKNSVQLGNYKHIKPFPAEVDKYEFLNCVDALITDYSSVFFDFSVTRKPVILYIYDYDKYMQDRGMYMDIQELPFVKLHKIEELSEWLSTEKILNESYDDDDYCNKFIKYDSLDAPKKMLDLLLYGKEDGLVMQDYSANKEVEHRIIHPKRIRCEGDFNVIAAYAGENDIVQFEKKWFKKNVSCRLYDEFNDAFNYVVITNTTPRTYLEEVQVKLGVESVKQRLAERELKRTFPGLKVSAPYIRDFYVPETGCGTFNITKDDISAEVVRGDREISLKISSIEDYDMQKFMILNGKGIVMYVRDITDEEKKNGIISLSYETLNEVIEPSSSYSLVADKYDKAKSERNLAVLLNVKKRLYAEVIKIKSKKSSCEVRMKLRKQFGLEFKDVVIRYRNAASYDNPLKYNLHEDSEYYYINVFIDFENMPLREIYWDLRVLGEFEGQEQVFKVKFMNMYWKYNFYLTNRQYSAGEGHMIFPYYTKGACLAFLYRQDSEYDAYSTKIKEMAAVCAYGLLKPIYKRKKIWLVYEKFCSMAQDNGYYFFKYCMENLSEKDKKNIYYVIDKKAPDYEKIKQYDDHIIQFMSFKHCLYVLRAVLYVASDSRTHLYAWRCKTSLLMSKIRKRPIFFLQHGVTALKQVAPLFGRKGSSPMTYFATTSQFEQDIVVEFLKYNRNKAPITGFTRWDVLEDKSKDDDKLILIMPTWRSWLEEVSDEDFLASDYYRNYSGILQSEKLSEILKENNTRIIFYIHPKFAGYLKNFKKSGENISLVPFGEKPLNEIMMKCHLLITDYSSVCWDVYYQKKPVIFYQFDVDKYNMAHGSYIDMETELFGRKAANEEELLNEIEECIKSGFALLPQDEKDHHHYFEYIDDKNSERTYEFLKERGY